MLTNELNSINIRPGVKILSVLSHLNYQPWYALAEFVDNSIQSYQRFKSELTELHPHFKLQIKIELDIQDGGRITVRDNAAGIHQIDYARAFRAAEAPIDRSGLGEFGMGMKSAACWFSPNWLVRTSALGESFEKTVIFDINTIVNDQIEELKIETRPIYKEAHFTELVLTNLHRKPQKKTVAKIKEHLSSIYRVFIREGLIELSYNGETLTFNEPKVLVAPYFKDPSGTTKNWRKNIDFDFGNGLRAYGFAGLLDQGSYSSTGFALFRRKRLIQGSADEGYRPGHIFSSPNSAISLRLFGELELEGFEVSHTKDGFRWEENEETFLELLKEEINRDPLPLLRQADGYRSKPNKTDLKRGAEIANTRTADTLQRESAPVLGKIQVETAQTFALPNQELPIELPQSTIISSRVIEVDFHQSHWQIFLELSNDPAQGDWIEIFDRPSKAHSTSNNLARSVGIRMSLAHPFMEQYGGTDPNQIEPLLRVAAALGLAEVVARQGGAKYVGQVRENLNSLLREALSKP